MAAFVVSRRRSEAPWARGFRGYLIAGLLIVVLRVVYRILFGGDYGDHVLVTLPEIPLPDWAIGITLGGAITLESILAAAYDGLRLATLIICIGAANVLADPRRLLRSVPSALYEMGATLVVAVSVAPQLAESVGRVRRARRLRGGSGRGPRALMGIVIPVLEDALHRSLALAAAMDARGYGRSAHVPARTRRLTGALVIGGLLGICVGAYGVLDETVAPLLGMPMLVAGAIAAIAGFTLGGRRIDHTTYRPDPWTTTESLVAASGLAAAILMIDRRHHGPGVTPALAHPARVAPAGAARDHRDPRRGVARLARPTRPDPDRRDDGARGIDEPAGIGRPNRSRHEDELMIRFESVTVTYSGSDTAALRDVDVRIAEGELCLVIGPTGSGKSTFLGAINGLVPHFTGGTLLGTVTVDGRDTRTHPPRELADVVGYVGQDPLAGFVTDAVEEELAYSMEHLALDPQVMRKRVEEILDLLGLADLRDRPLRTLSGGQQQRVAIGAALTAHPRILVLDEPTSALDPTAAEEVIAAITRLVHDLGMTVVLAEHRLERVIQHADRVVAVTADGRVVEGLPATVLAGVDDVPPIVGLARLAGWDPLPLSIRDARRLAPDLRLRLADRPPAEHAPDRHRAATASIEPSTPALVAARTDRDVRPGGRRARRGPDAGEPAGSRPSWAGTGPASPRSCGPSRGPGRAAAAPSWWMGAIPRSSSLLRLVASSVSSRRTRTTCSTSSPSGRSAVRRIGSPGRDPVRAAGCWIASWRGSRTTAHPRDLSEGQRLATVLAIQLVAGPRVMLLDEPTRGLDYAAKRHLAGLLRELAADGRAILLSTHDVEFVATVADRVLVMADGEIVADGSAEDVLVASPAFAPQVARILAPGRWLTVDDVARTLSDPTVVTAAGVVGR